MSIFIQGCEHSQLAWRKFPVLALWRAFYSTLLEIFKFENEASKKYLATPGAQLLI